jgi:hypothetical protein
MTWWLMNGARRPHLARCHQGVSCVRGEAASMSDNRLGGRHILVVEDNAILAMGG